MKKILAICLSVILAASLCVTAFAAPDGFLSSPSGNSAPTVVGFTADDEDCTSGLVITAYVNKDTLASDDASLMEEAYKSIADNSSDLSALNADFAALIKGENIPVGNLVVSDLFDASCNGCTNHDGHHGFSITLGADTLKNFVALLHMNHSGEWELVSNAKVSEDGTTLDFYVDSCSPFAIVVNNGTDTTGTTPPTGDNSMIALWISLMAVCVLAVVVILVATKKKNNK